MNTARGLRLLRTALLAGIAWLALGQAARSYRVEGVSMQPTLQSGERILASPLSVRLFGIRRGDLVVFRSPRDQAASMVKRVVALPGDTVRFEPDDVLVDVTGTGPGKRGPAPAPIGPDRYFVVGDNRIRSRDSRHFGALPGSAILGKVFFRYWPPGRVGAP